MIYITTALFIIARGKRELFMFSITIFQAKQLGQYLYAVVMRYSKQKNELVIVSFHRFYNHYCNIVSDKLWL